MTRPAPDPARFSVEEHDVPAHRFSHEAMATVFEIRCVHRDDRYAAQAAHEAFALVDRLEQELSRFVGNSDVSRINTLGAGESTRVGASTMECLDIARGMYEVTAGAFDISLGTGLTGLEIVPDEFLVRSITGGIRLDLGGIGKGYAVDRVADLLEEWQVTQALAHGGFSSVRALEAPTGGEGWPMTLSAPDDGELLAKVTTAHEAWSASGVRRRDHIVDPRSGAAVAGRAAWVAVAAQAAARPGTVAEALSTAFMVLGVDEIAAICGGGGGLEAWLFSTPASAGEAPQLLHFGPPGRSSPPDRPA